MPSPNCIANVQSEPPPDNRLCSDAFCAAIQSNIDSHCTRRHLNPDDPVISNEPGFGYCYCCCSCFAHDTLIESAPNVWTMVQDIAAGDEILATGLSLQWAPHRVQYSSGIARTTTPIPAMYYVRYTWESEEDRYVIVTADHPFLLADNSLKTVQKLVPGDKLKRADGAAAEVVFVAVGPMLTGISSIQMGDFDGKNLDGHLLNSNGIVTADYAVQVYIASQRIDPKLVRKLSAQEDRLDAGTRAYHEQHRSKAYDAFVANPDAWPRGFSPTRRREINVPATAKRFFTDKQADDIRRNAPRGGENNTFPAQSVLYLFNAGRGLYPRVTFLLDWDNEAPNAFWWQEWDQDMIVITGGLARIQGLDRNGLAVILASMLAYRIPDVECVGPADYNGVFFVMREMWESNLFILTVRPGLDQMAKLFQYVDPKHAGEDPNARCRRPSLDCRLQTFAAAVSLLDIPECALPHPGKLDLLRAVPNVPIDSVRVYFNAALDPASGSDPQNFNIEPQVSVARAQLDRLDPRIVELTVLGLARQKSYVLTVEAVRSQTGAPIDPQRNITSFKT